MVSTEAAELDELVADDELIKLEIVLELLVAELDETAELELLEDELVI